MNRQVKRDNQRIINTFKRKAIKDMEEWLLTLTEAPTKDMIIGFKAGYIAGFNRGVGQNG